MSLSSRTDLVKSRCVRYGTESAVVLEGLIFTPIKFPLFTCGILPSIIFYCLCRRFDVISVIPGTILLSKSKTFRSEREIRMAFCESLVPGWRSGAQLPHSINVLRPSLSIPEAWNIASIPYPSMHRPGPIPTGEANTWPLFVWTARLTSCPPCSDSYQYGSRSHSAALKKHPRARSCLYESVISMWEITYHCG